jgi:hypothetical protein
MAVTEAVGQEADTGYWQNGRRTTPLELHIATDRNNGIVQGPNAYRIS